MVPNTLCVVALGFCGADIGFRVCADDLHFSPLWHRGPNRSVQVAATCRAPPVLWAPPRPPRLASEMGWAGAEALGGGEGGFCAALMCLGAVCGVSLQERRLTVSAQAVLWPRRLCESDPGAGARPGVRSLGGLSGAGGFGGQVQGAGELCAGGGCRTRRQNAPSGVPLRACVRRLG